MIPRPNKPLTNTQRILILQEKLGGGSDYISDLEKDHFGFSSRSMMRAFMGAYVQAKNDNFDSVYDDYLLYLWDQLNTTPPVVGGDNTGRPMGLLLALTYN